MTNKMQYFVHDEANVLIKGCANRTQRKIIDEVCARAPSEKDLLGVFELVAAASVLYQDALVLKHTLAVAAQKLSRDSVVKLANDAVRFSLKNKEAGHLDCALSFMKDHGIALPPLEEGLAQAYEQKSTAVSDVLIEHGADGEKALGLYHLKMMEQIKALGEEMLELRRAFDAARKDHGQKEQEAPAWKAPVVSLGARRA